MAPSNKRQSIDPRAPANPDAVVKVRLVVSLHFAVHC